MISPGDNGNHDKEWADMKKGWKATSVAETFMTEKLRWSLRLRMVGSWLWLGLEVASLMLLAVIATVELVRGNVIAGVALMLFNLAAAGASIWARRSRLHRATGSLMELIDLTIHRARRSERFAWAQYFTTVAAIVFVVAMYFSNVGDTMTPYNDAGRAIGTVTIFLVYAMGVGIYHGYARRRARRFKELQRSFAANGTV
jgi:hypothetical protein